MDRQEPPATSASQLRADALRIWQASVDAVRPERLLPQWLRVEGDTLLIGNEAAPATHRTFPLGSIRRIAVVGGGKAAAGMSLAVEQALGPKLMAEKQLFGWVNVPARGESCQPAPQYIHLHVARPAGVNEPTPEGVAGAAEILRIVESLGPDDLCLCLLSGGASALIPAPIEEISLTNKLAVTRFLSAAGANIEQLNTVRKQLSRIKGGGLLRACRAGRLASMIISDVLGDPLDVIASGPTAPDSSTPQAALDVLEQFGARKAGIAPAVFRHLERTARAFSLRLAEGTGDRSPMTPAVDCVNVIIANNATAVEAAGQEGRRFGYSVMTESAARSEGCAEDVGRDLAQRGIEMRNLARPTCLVSGGEPVVALVDQSQRGLGGRNQQLVLAALVHLLDNGSKGLALLSGGTDGEDGPTDAAGAFLDADVQEAANRSGLEPSDFLRRNDAYHFFASLNALLRTGPTGTNVCDVRVVLAGVRDV